MSQIPVLISGTIVWTHEEIKEMQNNGYDMLPLESSSREEFAKECSPGGKYSEIVAIYRHNSSADAIGVFDKELIKLLPKTVKYICHNGAGYDQIDIQACTERGIQVSNTPGAVDDATATTAMYLILAALRGFQRAEGNARKGNWKTGLNPANDPEKKVLGIIGMGGIGQALAKRALGFSMKIQYHNRKPVPSSSLTPPLNESNVKYIDNLKELLSSSDVVSLNLPLNDKTRGFFDREKFSWMKDESCLVNTARGGVIDEEALLEALSSNKLKSAGLDVFPNEPEINPKLVENPKVALLPHMGTETKESQHKMEVRALDNIKAAIKTGTVHDIVIEQLNAKL